MIPASYWNCPESTVEVVMPNCSERPIVDLIARAQHGSSGALGRLLEDCRPYLLLVANRELDAEVRVKVGASDVVQETFLEAHRDFAGFSGATEAALFAWLRQILVNNIRDATRHYCAAAKRDVAREVPWEDAAGGAAVAGRLATLQTPIRQLDKRERQLRLEQALQRLNPAQRDLIALRNLQLLSFVEIGRLTGRTPDAVRKAWGRAVRALSRELGDDPVG